MQLVLSIGRMELTAVKYQETLYTSDITKNSNQKGVNETKYGVATHK